MHAYIYIYIFMCTYVCGTAMALGAVEDMDSVGTNALMTAIHFKKILTFQDQSPDEATGLEGASQGQQQTHKSYEPAVLLWLGECTCGL